MSGGSSSQKSSMKTLRTSCTRRCGEFPSSARVVRLGRSSPRPETAGLSQSSLTVAARRLDSLRPGVGTSAERGGDLEPEVRRDRTASRGGAFRRGPRARVVRLARLSQRETVLPPGDDRRVVRTRDRPGPDRGHPRRSLPTGALRLGSGSVHCRTSGVRASHDGARSPVGRPIGTPRRTDRVACPSTPRIVRLARTPDSRHPHASTSRARATRSDRNTRRRRAQSERRCQAGMGHPRAGLLARGQPPSFVDSGRRAHHRHHHWSDRNGRTPAHDRHRRDVAGMRRCVLVPHAPHPRVASGPQSVLTPNQ